MQEPISISTVILQRGSEIVSYDYVVVVSSMSPLALLANKRKIGSNGTDRSGCSV